MRLNKDRIVILLGAGCSVEAGIPSSNMMINDLEALISGEKIEPDEKVEWENYRELYSFIKSSIIYSFGLNKKFSEKANYNIEKLVDTLSELEKRHAHSLYPFISEWDKKLIQYAGEDFIKIKELKKHIVNKLQNWVTITNYNDAHYYCKFIDFRKEYTFPLRVFSLNYDLCLEKHTTSYNLETGFDSTSRTWSWRKFEEIENVSTVDIYLYKMHGSINWFRDSEENLTYSDEVVKISQPELIFGTSYKLQYTDPYLFFATEFRKYTLEAQMIITIGYGFGDEHINSMLSQAVRNDKSKRIFSVMLNGNHDLVNIVLKPKDRNQIFVKNMKAKEFVTNELSISKLEEMLPLTDQEDLPFSE